MMIKNRNTQTKKIVKSGVFSGIIFATLTSGSDYLIGGDFSIWEFIFDASFFGVFIALFTRYNLKKEAKKKKEKTDV